MDEKKIQEKEIYHGWFSNIQKNILMDPIRLQHCKYHKLNTSIYLTDKGKEVEISEASRNINNGHSKRFQDSQYMGILVKYLRPQLR